MRNSLTIHSRKSPELSHKARWIMLSSRFAAILTLLFAFVYGTSVLAQTVAPLGGVGSLQFYDNNGNLLTNGVVYIYAAGTTTQVPVYTSATGTTQQPNPVTFGVGARAQIWLAVGSFVKIVLCLQNDGPFCAASDVLFSADQVPIGSSSSGGGGSTFTGTFISGSGNPATTGILRLASGDQICWRNNANSTNLCISKDTNDLLSWAGGSLKFPQVTAPTPVPGFDLLWADSGVNRWRMSNNGGVAQYVVGITTPGTAGDLAILAPNGIDVIDGGAVPGAIGAACTNFTPVTSTNNIALTNMQSCTVAANLLLQGSMLEVNAQGVVGTGVGAPYTLSITVSLGGGTVCTTVANTGASNFQPWHFAARFFVLTNGATGTGNWSCSYDSSSSGGGVVGNNGSIGLPTISVNTTITNTIQITATMSVANANNTITEQGLKAVIF
jgi:hypothetical protein